MAQASSLRGQWAFITLNPPNASETLPTPAPGTALFACPGGNPSQIINLSATRLEGTKVIADFAPNPSGPPLRPGDHVFQSKLPIALTPPKPWLKA